MHFSSCGSAGSWGCFYSGGSLSRALWLSALQGLWGSRCCVLPTLNIFCLFSIWCPRPPAVHFLQKCPSCAGGVWWGDQGPLVSLMSSVTGSDQVASDPRRPAAHTGSYRTLSAPARTRRGGNVHLASPRVRLLLRRLESGLQEAGASCPGSSGLGVGLHGH